MNNQTEEATVTARDCGDVLVVGGGIGGVAAAIGLRRGGASVTLVERAEEFAEVGAGLQMAPNATRVLERWGLLGKLLEVGVAPKNIVFRDAVTGEELIRQDLEGEFLARYGSPYVVVHRSDLHRILIDEAARIGIVLENNTAVTGYETVADRGRVTVADGGALEAEVVLGADGIRSILRTELSHDEPIASGYVAFRGALPLADVAHASDMESVVVWLGPNCHLVQYPLRAGEMFNTVAVFQSPAFLRGEDVWGSEDELEEAFAECVPQVRNALGNLWRARSWPMFDREPIDRWVDGRLALIGDAAHPMLQYLAQGACQAIEDAGALEAITARHGASAWDQVLSEYETERVPRTARVQKVARLWGESWHVSAAVPKLMRNLLFKSASGNRLFGHIDWLYGAPRESAAEARSMLSDAAAR